MTTTTVKTTKPPRRGTKRYGALAIQETTRLALLVGARLLATGGTVTETGSRRHAWRVETKVGLLHVDVYVVTPEEANQYAFLTIFGRFVDAARASVDTSCNSHSGKWNYLAGEVTNKSADDAYAVWNQRYSAIALDPAAPAPAPDPTTLAAVFEGEEVARWTRVERVRSLVAVLDRLIQYDTRVGGRRHSLATAVRREALDLFDRVMSVMDKDPLTGLEASVMRADLQDYATPVATLTTHRTKWAALIQELLP